MPNVNRKLITSYLVHQFGVMTQVLPSERDETAGVLTFNFKNKADSDLAFTVIEQLLRKAEEDESKPAWRF